MTEEFNWSAERVGKKKIMGKKVFANY